MMRYIKWIECPYCGKEAFDDLEQYCLHCGKGFTNQTRKREKGWKAEWTQTYISCVKLHLEVFIDYDPGIIFVNVVRQLGTTHITEAGFDRKLHPTGRIPLNEFLEICTELYKGKIPSSKVGLAEVLGITEERIGQLVRQKKLPVKHKGTAWFWRPLSVRVAYRIHKKHGVAVRTRTLPTELKEENLGPDDFYKT